MHTALAALFFGTAALVGIAGLLALAPNRPRRAEPYALPAARTLALITVAAAIVAALFQHLGGTQ
ncbi:hypothetical protein [Streptomyces sp. Isolate_219]|uniref:hypothetical protein n=1 Tax=Streptomyces sp. Isolate_219 TaxID=2950110 RepID=UPI0021C6C880|nr:hypothetical protein [Streptomyces sp. Isolate_219]MCR8574699.1 hypothetical protein [Streptomyces sp. Isolate_219]